MYENIYVHIYVFSLRFIVFEKYEQDLQKFRKKNRMTEKFSLIIVQQILHVLEYMHGLGYSHGDIKSSNIMLNGENVVLIDYGLVQLFLKNGEHVPYSVKAERKDNGTTMFCSLDAHNGASKNLYNYIFL